jgi:hypothetical protein
MSKRLLCRQSGQIDKLWKTGKIFKKQMEIYLLSGCIEGEQSDKASHLEQKVKQ